MRKRSSISSASCTQSAIWTRYAANWRYDLAIQAVFRMYEYGLKTESAVTVCARQSPSRFAAMPRPFCPAFSVFQSDQVGRGVCLSAARSAALVSRLSHIFMDTINSLSFGYYASYYIDN